MDTATATLTKQKRQRQTKQRLPHKPNYITINPPGDVLQEKIAEMGIDAVELAKRMNVPLKTVQQMLCTKIPLTPELADKIEQVTEMPANVMMRLENRYREKWKYAMQHPEIPAYHGNEIINLPPLPD